MSRDAWIYLQIASMSQWSPAKVTLGRKIFCSRLIAKKKERYPFFLDLFRSPRGEISINHNVPAHYNLQNSLIAMSSSAFPDTISRDTNFHDGTERGRTMGMIFGS